MYVCESCHEIDKNVTKCKFNFEMHAADATGICAICGEHTYALKWCYYYEEMVAKNGGHWNILEE